MYTEQSKPFQKEFQTKQLLTIAFEYVGISHDKDEKMIICCITIYCIQ